MTDQNPQQPPSPGQAMAVGMAQVIETLAPILDATIGYRQRCMEAGFDEMTASMMASEYHNQILNMIVSRVSH